MSSTRATALAHLEHLVVQDIFLTETAKYADVVLPASAWPEKDGTVSNTNRQVQMGRTALPLPGNARLDLMTIQEIARRMGLDWRYAGPADVFAEMKLAMPSLDNITWERLLREDSVTYPCDAEDQPGNEIVFGDGFPTAVGPRQAGAGLDHPARRGARRRISAGADYRAPARALAYRRDDPPRHGARRDRARGGGEPRARGIAQARRRGRRPGRVTTRRGHIELKARADSNVAPGMVFVPFCYAEAAANILTNPQLDPIGKIPEFKYCAAKVEPVAVKAAARIAFPFPSGSIAAGVCDRERSPLCGAPQPTAARQPGGGPRLRLSPAPYQCVLPSEQRMLVAELFFGRDKSRAESRERRRMVGLPGERRHPEFSRWPHRV